jgi:ribosomal-protein-alanine N-acetyltransferase
MSLASTRVELVLPPPADAARVAAFQRANRAFLAAQEPPRPDAYYTEAHWAHRLAELAAAAAADQQYGYFVQLRASVDATAPLVGWLSFSNVVRGAFHACYLGYHLSAGAEGHGYMTEALRVAIDHMFGAKNLHRIMANYVPTNTRSERVLRRIGFEREGLAKSYLYLGGAWRDHVLTSLTNPAWRAP